MNYNHISHTHCWDNPSLPCGIPLEKHEQCCLCDLKKNDCSHELEYQVREYTSATYIMRGCQKCGLQEETAMSPVNWYPIGKITHRIEPSNEKI